jgi:predicted RNA binding protein YcfA (HicA-like mRNA interferase family)
MLNKARGASRMSPAFRQNREDSSRCERTCTEGQQGANQGLVTRSRAPSPFRKYTSIGFDPRSPLHPSLACQAKGAHRRAMRPPSSSTLRSGRREQLARHQSAASAGALLRAGWVVKRQSGSHRTLSRADRPDFVFAFHVFTRTTSSAHGF